MPLQIILKYLTLALLWFAPSIVNGETQIILTLEKAIEMAIQNNPDLAQMQARAEAMAAIPSQVGTLPDPEISFSAMSLPTNSFNVAQEDMTQIGPGISQAIPFPGKLALRSSAATFEAKAALENVTEARWWLLSNVKQIWWQVFYLDHALQVVKDNQSLLKQFIQITRIKYEVGEGLQQDILLAQLELSNLLDQQLKLEGARRNSAAQLNALLDQAANQPVTLPEEIAEELPTVISETALYQLAEHSRALLASKHESINAARARVDLAKRDFYPDFKLGASYGFRRNGPTGIDRADFLTLDLSMNVPIFLDRKQAKAVDQRNSELMQQKYMLQDEWNKVRAQISQSYSDFQRATEQTILFKTGIIPQARQTVESMLLGYQVSKVDFLNLIRSQIALFNHELRYWNAFAEANQALAQLTAAVGKEAIYE
ncbi:Outer membrane protein TolC [Nitrosomonas cryotolerans]|uniref:Outer membrane protein TolC n=1 Tax=Nitrosomonas cryotolerans ATCC 49181 TaxID=1131553 RepID=A0A1N6HET7_9PROT|nr:TolC family protein [Nitrosomonas cryotolerans]SFP73220.1 Outer membrane protein TolC [Nitrosomonas cryotolerans]SIO18125.1 Outer membrane protein TolC [Nitrosomonas cryotolerans ATCC 49181]